MISSVIVILIIYFGFILLLLAERGLQLLIERWINIRHNKNDRVDRDCFANWDWLIELENQPIEVTFDHETFLVFGRDTGRWGLEHRKPKPSDEFEITPFWNGYSPRKRTFGIHSPSGGREDEKTNNF